MARQSGDYEIELQRRQAARLSMLELFDAAHGPTPDPRWAEVCRAEIKYRADHLEDVTNPTVVRMFEGANEKHRRMRSED